MKIKEYHPQMYEILSLPEWITAERGENVESPTIGGKYTDLEFWQNVRSYFFCKILSLNSTVLWILWEDFHYHVKSFTTFIIAPTVCFIGDLIHGRWLQHDTVSYGLFLMIHKTLSVSHDSSIYYRVGYPWIFQTVFLQYFTVVVMFSPFKIITVHSK